MDPQPTETPNLPSSEVRTLESALRALWDRVRQAGEVISSLKEERRTLQSQVQDLQARVQQLTRESQQREETLKALADEKRASETNGFITNGEREAMATRLKDLLARIDAYL